MVFKEILNGLNSKKIERKEKFKEIDESIRMQKIIEERQKSSNQRELERYIKEEQEKRIKQELEEWRKVRQQEDNYGHNPLSIPNITNKSSWEVLKEKNMFRGGNIFANQKRIY